MWHDKRCESADSMRSRIYVGNLGFSQEPGELTAHFSKYGEIIASTVLKGFGFIQFSNEDSAKKAIEAENMSLYNGICIHVKAARRTMDHEYPVPTDTQGRGGHIRGGRGRGFGWPSWNDQAVGGHMQSRQYMPSHPVGPPERTNDCEIVCINKAQRDYAEMVESKLKVYGIQSDILFPNPDISLTKILVNIASRGVMYGVALTQQNEEQRTITVNFLQGQKQQHRNMPLDDAVNLMVKTFKTSISSGSPVINHSTEAMHQAPPPVLSKGLPRDISNVVGFLVEDRPLSVMEYDKLIRYLAGKREEVLRQEYGSDIPSHLVTPPIGPAMDPSLKAKQEEIQTRVLRYLSKPIKQLFGSGDSGRNDSSPLNPALRRALDSLITTGPNLLSNSAVQSSSVPYATGWH